MADKNLYIIAGCNGAGKTSASVTILPEILHCKEFVNADAIAKGISPFNPESVAVEAGRLMLQRIDFLLNGDSSFAIETTLATRSYSNLVRRAQQRGFLVQLLFFWLPSPEYAVERVAQCVSEGGHNIPNDVIVRRYFAGIKNLFDIYMPIVDSWMIIDNSVNPRVKIAKMNRGIMVVFDENKYNSIKNYERR